MIVPSYQLVDEEVFKAVRQILLERTGKGLFEADVRLINAALAIDDPKPASIPARVTNGLLTVKVVLELLGHEAIIQEMYKDSVGVPTWSGGLTDASGINVLKYKDNPASMQECINAVIDRLRKVYVPRVFQAFVGIALSEAQFAAALSFDYNTGAVTRATWVKLFREGKTAEAYAAFLNWNRPPEIIERRKAERELFFSGVWTQDGKTKVYKVRKPSYAPDWRSLKRVDVTTEIRQALGA